MEDNFELKNCNQHEVLSVGNNVFKVFQFHEALTKVFLYDSPNFIK